MQKVENQVQMVKVESITPNPHNPRMVFNEDALDQLKTSIQEVGVLVSLIMYRPGNSGDSYVLLDGERRWKCALELGLETVPANVIQEPSESENLSRMFNIHSVRAEWPLISIAVSLRKMIAISGDDGEKSLAERTGLNRSTVRRAKRLLSLPENELNLIVTEAHLNRNEQVHREDLYLEVEAAVSVMFSSVEEIEQEYTRAGVIRKFIEKREAGTLTSVTEFRNVGKIVKAINLSNRGKIVSALKHLIDDVNSTPSDVYAESAAAVSERNAWLRKWDQLIISLEGFADDEPLDDQLRQALERMSDKIGKLLESK